MFQKVGEMENNVYMFFNIGLNFFLDWISYMTSFPFLLSVFFLLHKV